MPLLNAFKYTILFVVIALAIIISAYFVYLTMIVAFISLVFYSLYSYFKWRQ